ncbi:MAG: hypothetical protein ACTHOB_05860 [Ginsengibacter sp.]
MFKTACYVVVNFILAIPNSILYALLFVSYLILEYFNFHLTTDAAMQLQTLTNFVSGHGISITTLNENNQVIYQACSLWPAGLVVLLTPVYLLTHNTVASFIIIKAIGFIFFILFLIRYLVYLQLKDHQRKFIIFFFILWAVPVVEFYASDMIATSICLWSFYYFLKFLDNEKTGYLFLSIFLVASCYIIRYSFLPFLFYPALAFVLKEKRHVFKRIKTLLFIIFLTAVSGLFFYLSNLWLVGAAQMATRWDAFTGFAHWGQLSHFVGFLFTFGTYQWFFENMIGRIFDVNLAFNWISLLVTFYFCWILLKELFSKARNNGDFRFYNSIIISISAGLLIISFLCFLTINNPGQTWLPPYWTFVQDTRYYGPVIFIVLINVLLLFLLKKDGTLLHIIIPVMILLNLFTYRSIIQSGFWGNNYQSYAMMKKNITTEMPLDPSSQPVVVYFDKDTKNSNYYYYLQANGTIMMEKDRIDLHNNKLFASYILQKDSASYKIIKLN